MKHTFERFVGTRAPAITLLLILLMLTAGCTRTVYVPAVRVITRTDTCFYAKLRVDSVLMRDSVTVKQRGDTVFIDRWRDRFRYSERIDTVYRASGDTVREEVPVPVERELTRWEQVKMDAGWFAIGAGTALLVAVVALLVWLIKVKRRR